jgi:hypothetical protein
MAGDFQDFFRSQHAALAPECILEFSVVEASRAACDNEHRLITDPEADRFGDLPRIDSVRFGRKRHRRRAFGGFDDFDLRRMCAEKCADGFKAHGRIQDQNDRDLNGLGKYLMLEEFQSHFETECTCDPTGFLSFFVAPRDI